MAKVRRPLARVGGLRLLVTCACGQSGRVGLGTVWRCDRCGRTWDTGAVPGAEYRAFALAVRRTKWLALAGVVLIVPLFGLLALLVDRAFLPLLPAALGVWYFWFLPFHRRRVRRLYASVPNWQISARGHDP